MSQCGSWEREKLPGGGDPLEELCVCGVSEGRRWGQGGHEGELSPSPSCAEESKPTQRESSLCEQPSHTWANQQNWDKVSKRWEIRPAAAFSSVSSAGSALMCWLHYLPASPRWMADLCRERWAAAPSVPGHKDGEGSWDRGLGGGLCLSVWWGTLLLCAEERIRPRKQMSSPNASRAAEKKVSLRVMSYSFNLSENRFQASNPLILYVGRRTDMEEVSMSLTQRWSLSSWLLLKINGHLDTNKSYGFSKYTSHIIQPREFPNVRQLIYIFLASHWIKRVYTPR